jgi:hypothetical protein
MSVYALMRLSKSRGKCVLPSPRTLDAAEKLEAGQLRITYSYPASSVVEHVKWDLANEGF